MFCFRARETVGLTKWVVVASAVFVLAGIGEAQSGLQVPSYAKVCASDNPTADTYWGHFFDAFPVSIPMSALRPRTWKTDTQAKACSPMTAFSSFDDLMSKCGYDRGLKVALSMDRSDFEATSFCGPEGSAKIVACKQLQTARLELGGTFGGAFGEGEDAPQRTRGIYRPVLRDSVSKNVLAIRKSDAANSGRVWAALNEGVASIACEGAPRAPFTVALPVNLFIGRDGRAVALAPGEVRNIKEIKPAEMGLSFDRANSTEIPSSVSGRPAKKRYNDFVTLSAAIGSEFLDTPSVSASLYTSIDYAERLDPRKETDDLRFGVYQILDVGLLGFANLDASWITDSEQRESAQWFVSGRLRLPGLDRFGSAERAGPLQWTVAAVADYNHVIEAGDKASLENIGEVSRIGYDIDWKFVESLVNISGWKPTLSGSYQYRDTIGEGAGNADLWKASLGILNLDENQASISFDYKRGETITSLQNVEDYQLTLKIKR